MAGKEPSKEDIKKILAKVKEAAGAKIDKSKQRIVDKSLSEKEKPPAKPKDKLDLVLEEIQSVKKDLKQYQEKTDKKLEVVIGAGNKPTQGQETKDQEDLTNEEILAQAQAEQEKAGGQEKLGQQPGQMQGQLTQDQYQKLNDSEKVKLLEAQLQQQQGGQPPSTGKLTGQQGLYGLIEILKATAPVVQTALGKGGGGEKSGESLESLGKDLVTGLLKKAIEGQVGGGGSDGTQQLQVFSNIQNQVLGNFFSTLKLLGKEPAQKMVSNIFANPNLPGFKSSEQRINP